MCRSEKGISIVFKKCYMQEIVGAVVEQEEEFCDQVITVKEFAYVSDRVSACGECEAAVIARTQCGFVEFRECGELLHARRFPLVLKCTVY